MVAFADIITDLSNFLGQTWVLALMAIALLALIGVMVFLRMKPKEEE